MAARPFLRALRRFRRRTDGSAAVEFAMIAGPFLLVLFALVEVGLISFAQTNLDYALSETARRIRTGEVQSEGLSAGDVHEEVCTNLHRIMGMDCDRLYVDVDRFVNFTAAGNPVPIADGQVDQAQIGYAQTQPGDVVLVRGYFEWRIITPFFQPIFSNIGGDSRLLVSSVLFRNEPFPAVAPGP
jgi:Flp pilus assembly protein TadG